MWLDEYYDREDEALSWAEEAYEADARGQDAWEELELREFVGARLGPSLDD